MPKRTYNQPQASIRTLFCLSPNVEELSATKNLSNTDSFIQKLNPCDGIHSVILPNELESNGMLFWIINSTIGIGKLEIYASNGTTLLSTLSTNEICHALCLGSQWGLYTPVGATGSIFDASLYYTKTEVDTMITNLRNELMNEINNIEYV